MKKLIYLGTFALLTTTLFSCTADDYETADKKTNLKKESLKYETQATDEGPGDEPIPIKPPKK